MKKMTKKKNYLLTMEASSTNFSRPIFVSLSVAEASLPRRIGVSNFLLNSVVVPRMPVLTKCSRLKYSSRSFWMGVPESRTRREVWRWLRAVYVRFSQFFNRWPWWYIGRDEKLSQGLA